MPVPPREPGVSPPRWRQQGSRPRALPAVPGRGPATLNRPECPVSAGSQEVRALLRRVLEPGTAPGAPGTRGDGSPEPLGGSSPLGGRGASLAGTSSWVTAFKGALAPGQALAAQPQQHWPWGGGPDGAPIPLCKSGEEEVEPSSGGRLQPRLQRPGPATEAPGVTGPPSWRAPEGAAHGRARVELPLLGLCQAGSRSE